MFIAHRGLVINGIKENTLEAFDAAVNSDKYVGFELDVRVTKDNEFIVYHDLIYRGSWVRNVMYEDMKQDNIPRLKDVLKINTNKIIMVEIKDYSIDLKKLAKILNRYNYKNIYVMSFNNKLLKELKKYITKIKIGSLNYIFNSEEDYKFIEFICLINSIITEKLINYFFQNNIEVFAYGIKDIKKIKYSNVRFIVDELIFK